MAWQALIPLGANLLSGLFGSRSQSRAQDQSAAVQRESMAAQERLMREAMAQQDRYYNQMLAQNYPRQRASNAALQHITDLYGLGDIYAAPTEGSLGGGAAFYPGAPVSAPQNGMIGGQGGFGRLNNWQPQYTGNAGYDDYLRDRFNAYTRTRGRMTGIL